MSSITRCLGLALLVLLGACSPFSESERATWGNEALAYFDAWATAYSDNDTYAVLDLYAPNATVEDRTGIFREAKPSVPTLLQGNTARLTRRVIDVHLGGNEAVALVEWPDYTAEYGVVLADFDGGYIDSETILLDATSLQRSVRADPATIGRYLTLFEDLAHVWEDGDPDQVAAFYAPDAVVRDGLSGAAATGHAAIARLAAAGQGSWATASIPVADEPESDPALFLDPVVYGSDPQRAVGVFEITDAGGCTYRTAVLWHLAGGVIVEESRYPEVESFRRCEGNDLGSGWWTGLELPGPRDRVETGVVATPAGNSISVRNGTPSLERLVVWGLDQYRAAGLTEPRVDSVTFEPTRQCRGVAGRVITAGTARDLVLCLYESELCTDPSCNGFALGARVGMLHELAHAWMLDELDDATRDQVLAVSGRTTWVDDEAAWGDRGVEYAAQVIAWGVVDEPISLVELGRPDCAEATAAFLLLTGVSPRGEACP